MNPTVKTKAIKSAEYVSVGDVVKCFGQGWLNLTYWHTYTVESVNESENSFCVRDDYNNVATIFKDFHEWGVVVQEPNTKPIRSHSDISVGDKVVCTDKAWVDITVGREYEVCNLYNRGFDIIDDAGDDRGVHEELFKDWQVVVAECPTQEHTQPIKEFTPKQSLLFTHEQNIMNVWTILDDLDMVVRSWDDMSDADRKGVIEGIGLLGNLKMVKLQKSFEELFKEVI